MTCPFPLVAFDLDGTLAAGLEFVWSLLHRGFGSDAVLRRRAKEGFSSRLLSYGEWFDTDLELLQAAGATRQAMLDLFSASVRPMPGAREVLEELAAQGRKLAVISGSVDLLLEHLFPGFRFDHVLINRLYFDSRGRLVGGKPTPYDMERKAAGLAHVAALEGLSVAQCAFLGDHENDLAALRLAGLGIAFNPCSPRVAAAARIVVDGPDLRQVLRYLS